MSGELLLRERKTLIQERLKANGRVLAADLAAEFNVSEDTIRRDLREMAAAGLCERVYGGALPVVPAAHTTLSERIAMAPERKAALARVAVGLIEPGMTVFLDAGSTNLAIAQLIEPDLPVFVADGTRIVNVLYNLLSNAARFSEPGGEVKLTVSGRTGRIQFIVEDEGAPMTEEMRLALLDRDDALTGPARQRGAGLGLQIVRAFVNMHGGTISLEKREPRGTRVIVSLPSDVALAGAAE